MTRYHTYPVGPLLDLADQFGREPTDTYGTILGDKRVAERFGVHRRTIATWRRRGTVPVHIADRVCVRIGRHIDELWPTTPTTRGER